MITGVDPKAKELSVHSFDLKDEQNPIGGKEQTSEMLIE